MGDYWENGMKELSLLVWLTQLGMSVALPPAGFILLAVWLRNRFDWGQWVIWVGVILGILCAIDGLRTSLKAMSRISAGKKEKAPPAVCFNDHD